MHAYSASEVRSEDVTSRNNRPRALPGYRIFEDRTWLCGNKSHFKAFLLNSIWRYLLSIVSVSPVAKYCTSAAMALRLSTRLKMGYSNIDELARYLNTPGQKLCLLHCATDVSVLVLTGQLCRWEPQSLFCWVYVGLNVNWNIDQKSHTLKFARSWVNKRLVAVKLFPGLTKQIISQPQS